MYIHTYTYVQTYIHIHGVHIHSNTRHCTYNSKSKAFSLVYILNANCTLFVLHKLPTLRKLFKTLLAQSIALDLIYILQIRFITKMSFTCNLLQKQSLGSFLEEETN